MSYERASIRSASGYTPGKQPISKDAIKLNTNENPYPPCDAVMAALNDVSGDALRRYPPPFADPFREVAAKVHGVDIDNIIAVNGGDELLRLAITTFVDPGRPIGVFEPSYSLYPVLAEIHGSPVFRVDLAADWSMPEDAARRFNHAGAPIVFVVSPHAPSGRLGTIAELHALARELGGVLVIDEAYVDFVDPARAHDAVRLVHEHPNVLLLRTLSKGYSLAGLRFGYGIGHRDLILPMLTKTRDSYNVDVVAQTLAKAALTHRDEAAKTWARVRMERAAMRDALSALGMTTAASESNFVLAQMPNLATSAAPTAADVCRILESRGVLVRHFSGARLDDQLRITIGTREENARLLRELQSILG